MEKNNQNKEPLNKDFKVPKLRFRDFSQSYEKSMLGTFDNNPMYGLNVSSKLFDGVNRYVRITDIDDYTHDLVSNDICSPSSFTKNYLLSEGDLLFARTGASVGKTYLYNSIHGLQYFAGYLIKFHFKDNLVAKYVFYSTQTTRYKNWVNVFSKRSGQPGINSEEYSKFEIYLPKSNELKKIVSFFELLERKIQIVDAKCEALKKYKEGIMKLCLSLSQNEGKTLKHLVSENELKVGRGTIIPRQEGIYPVYSSSAKNDGLFCYTNFYKYDEDLITWSIDGGGQPFYRKKHKFSITNVCGFIKIIDFVKWDYTWLYINIWNNWRHNKFDYTSKAHPSIIEEIYKIKPLSLDNQKKISSVFLVIEKHEKNLESKLNKLKEIKKYLLSNLFI